MNNHPLKNLHQEIYGKIYKFEQKRKTYKKHLIIASSLFVVICIIWWFDIKTFVSILIPEAIIIGWIVACIKNLYILQWNKQIKEVNKPLKRWKDVPSIQNILSRNEKILDITQSIRANHNLKTSSRTIYKMEFEYLIAILIDLRSDLHLRLTEQQQTLKSAKSEVEKNIVWTTKLNQVSELQRARLDRQIVQFEELQRVLVKI